MGDTFRTTQEFRENLLIRMAETKTSVEALRGDIADLKTGKYCVVGAGHEARLVIVEKSQERHWDILSELRRPVRKAMAVGGAGGLGLVAVFELVKQILAALR